MSVAAGSQALERNHVRLSGVEGAPVIVFAHGFGCDQTMWRHVVPAFETTHRVVLFDHVGSGRSDLASYDRDRYVSLHAYAEDVLELLDVLGLHDVTFVGHSVSAMIGVLAANAQPGRIGRLVLLGGSPRYVDEPGYTGGFARADADDLLEALESNHAEWSRSMAPVVMGTPGRPDLEDELSSSFLHTDAEVAAHFGRVTFLCDHRADVQRVRVPTLILQSTHDPIVPAAVASWLHEHLPGSRLVALEATGHYPHLSGPSETVRRIREFA